MQVEANHVHSLTAFILGSKLCAIDIQVSGRTLMGGDAMKRLRYSIGPFFFPAVFVLGLPGVTHSYIDPGTGSIVIQAVIGGFAAALVAIGMFWKQIKAFVSNLFSRFKHREPPQDQQH